MGADYFINNTLAFIVDFYNSTFFQVLKFLIAIYVFILFVDIILLIIQRGLGSNLRTMLGGADVPAEFFNKNKKAVLRGQWMKIRQRLEVGTELEYKIAIIEADNVIEDFIKRMGFVGENMKERLNSIPTGQIESIEDVLRAHEVRNSIIKDNEFSVTKEVAETALAEYEEVLKPFDIL